MRLFRKFKKKNKGQSFVELAIVFTALLVILLGVVEFGFLLNQYLELQDVVRELARYSSSGDPWHDPGFKDKVEAQFDTVMSRTHLSWKPSDGDSITLTFYQVNGASVTQLTVDGNNEMYICKDNAPTCGQNVSTFNIADIAADIDPLAPMSGIVVVEGFYRYHQLLGAPLIITYLPDPINVQTFSMMPMSAAEPNIP
jgi:hypothetical protein